VKGLGLPDPLSLEYGNQPSQQKEWLDHCAKYPLLSDAVLALRQERDSLKQQVETIRKDTYNEILSLFDNNFKRRIWYYNMGCRVSSLGLSYFSPNLFFIEFEEVINKRMNNYHNKFQLPEVITDAVIKYGNTEELFQFLAGYRQELVARNWLNWCLSAEDKNFVNWHNAYLKNRSI
jgi:hypothetical protein